MTKIKTIAEAEKIILNLKKKKKKSVLCHGVFDLLHHGHLDHFKEARKLGDKLFVSITPSHFVNKGPDRPYFDDNQRAIFLASIEFIDYVIINNDRTAINLIKKIKPSIYCKGPDYKSLSNDLTQNIKLEKKAIKLVRGKLAFTTGNVYSSSHLLNKYFNKNDKSKFRTIKYIKNKFKFSNIESIFNTFYNLKVLVFGEIIIDQYNFCRAIGKSGKEPIMVFKDLYSENYLGGSGYIARNLSSFCKEVDLVSIIGEDNRYNYYKFIKKKLEKNIRTKLIKLDGFSTIIKKRYIDNVSNSKILGVYKYSENLENKNRKKIYNITKKLKNYDLVLITDFGHDMIDQKLINILRKNNKFIFANSQLNAVNKGYHDLKRFKKVQCMILNESELRFELRDQYSNIEMLMVKLKKELKIKNLIITRGKEGVISLNNKNKFFYCDALTTKVVDKVGSGDCLMSVASLFKANKKDENLSLLCSSFAAAESVMNYGNEKIANKTQILKFLQHLLK